MTYQVFANILANEYISQYINSDDENERTWAENLTERDIELIQVRMYETIIKDCKN